MFFLDCASAGSVEKEWRPRAFFCAVFRLLILFFVGSFCLCSAMCQESAHDASSKGKNVCAASPKLLWRTRKREYVSPHGPRGKGDISPAQKASANSCSSPESLSLPGSRLVSSGSSSNTEELGAGDCEPETVSSLMSSNLVGQGAATFISLACCGVSVSQGSQQGRPARFPALSVDTSSRAHSSKEESFSIARTEDDFCKRFWEVASFLREDEDEPKKNSSEDCSILFDNESPGDSDDSYSD